MSYATLPHIMTAAPTATSAPKAPTAPPAARRKGFIVALDVPWKTIEQEYKEGVSPADLARKYSIKPDTIYARISRCHWEKPKPTKPDTLRTTLKAIHAKALAKLPEPTPKTIAKHAETLYTLTRSAALVEGWDSSAGSSIINLAVVQVRSLPAPIDALEPCKAREPVTIDIAQEPAQLQEQSTADTAREPVQAGLSSGADSAK